MTMVRNCHCEERSDEAISNEIATAYRIAIGLAMTNFCLKSEIATGSRGEPSQ
jgi:hypothetical protein